MAGMRVGETATHSDGRLRLRGRRDTPRDIIEAPCWSGRQRGRCQLHIINKPLIPELNSDEPPRLEIRHCSFVARCETAIGATFPYLRRPNRLWT